MNKKEIINGRNVLKVPVDLHIKVQSPFRDKVPHAFRDNEYGRFIFNYFHRYYGNNADKKQNIMFLEAYVPDMNFVIDSECKSECFYERSFKKQYPDGYCISENTEVFDKCPTEIFVDSAIYEYYNYNYGIDYDEILTNAVKDIIAGYKDYFKIFFDNDGSIENLYDEVPEFTLYIHTDIKDDEVLYKLENLKIDDVEKIVIESIEFDRDRVRIENILNEYGYDHQHIVMKDISLYESPVYFEEFDNICSKIDMDMPYLTYNKLWHRCVECDVDKDRYTKKYTIDVNNLVNAVKELNIFTNAAMRGFEPSKIIYR